MYVFSWDNLKKIDFSSDKDLENSFFKNGSAITVGSFDGPHKGHECLFKSVIDYSKKMKCLAGIVTFYVPLAYIKQKNEYLGDISTLKQRLDIYKKIGFDFCVLIDFTDDFKILSGVQFLDFLKDFCKMRFMAEGCDFRFGYQGAFDIKDIENYANENKMEFEFLNLILQNKRRVSSSVIRKNIFEGEFEKANKFLYQDYSLDLSKVDSNENIYKKNDIFQVLPKQGVYKMKVNGVLKTVKISEDDIYILDF